MSYRLYIPGPLTVSDSIIKAMGKPMIGHRSKDFVALYEDMQPRLQKMFYTTDPVYLGTSGLGSHGRCTSKCMQERGTQLHERRIFR
jgi:aspartate aminotransferase-like enzyme